MHILVVMEDQRLAALIHHLLHQKRHTVDAAPDGCAGRLLGLNSAYDVIVLDMYLPGLDGVDLCRELRAEGIVAPVLLCGTHNSVDDCVTCFDAGADDFLVKPFDLDELLARIHALGRRGRRQQSDADQGRDATYTGAREPENTTMREQGSVTGRLSRMWEGCRRLLAPAAGHRWGSGVMAPGAERLAIVAHKDGTDDDVGEGL